MCVGGYWGWGFVCQRFSVFDTGTLCEEDRRGGTMGGRTNTFQVSFKEAMVCGLRAFLILEHVFSFSNFLHFSWVLRDAYGSKSMTTGREGLASAGMCSPR